MRSTTDPANTEAPRPLFFVPLAQRVNYPDPMMQWVDDLTHIAGDAVLKFQGSPEGLEARDS